MNLKKFFAILLIVVVAVSLGIACAVSSEDTSAIDDDALRAAEQARKDSLEREVNIALSLGLEYYKNGQYADAIPHFKRIIFELDPEENRAWKYLADSYLRLDQPDSAFAVYSEGIQKFPEISYLHRGLGILYQKMEMMDSAMVEYRLACELDPKEAYSAAQIGRIYLSCAQLDSSIEWFEKSTVADSNDIAVWERLAELYMVRANWEGVREAYRNLSRVDPENAEYLLNFGRALANTGEYEKAVSTLESYIESNPKDYRGFHYMALVHAANKKYDLAQDAFSKGEELDPSNVKLLLDRADTYVDMKSYSSARKYLNKARAIDPNSCQAIIVDGNLCLGKARDAVPEDGLGVKEKLQFECCYNIYRGAVKSECEHWAQVARVKLNYLEKYLPTATEKKEFFFIHPELEGKICD